VSTDVSQHPQVMGKNKTTQSMKHKICKFDCCTRECNSNTCQFEHVKGVRTLLKDEMEFVKGEIKKYNDNPQMSAAKKLKKIAVCWAPDRRPDLCHWKRGRVRLQEA
jgi:hypothetical protein